MSLPVRSMFRECVGLKLERHHIILVCVSSYAGGGGSVAQSCLSVTPWTAAHQAPLSFTVSWSLLKFMAVESVMLFTHLILCCTLLLLPSIFPSVRVFSRAVSSHQVAKVLELKL